MFKIHFVFTRFFAKLLRCIETDVKTKGLRAMSLTLFAFGLLYFPINASAFKVGTHVWVAQQVLNDLDDGKVTISIGGVNYDATVDPAIVAAIKNHPAEYRMGNIGPDAFPDVLTGQMVVHPGVEGGWKTDDWLRFLLQQAQTPDQMAFAYGYLGHASADVFAHTYINQYAGDIFVLTDGEIDVETRHIALESYIENHTPALTDTQGNFLGMPYELVSTPRVFLRDKLILNDTVSPQYLSGMLLHLSGVHALRKTLDGTHPFLDQMDADITKAIVLYYTDIQLNDQQARDLFTFANNLHKAINDNNGLDNIQHAKDVLSAHIEKSIGIQTDIQNRLTNAMNDLWSAKNKRDQAILDLANNSLEMANMACHATPIPPAPCPSCDTSEVCGGWPIRVCVPVPAPPECFVTKNICETNNSLLGTVDLCDINPAYILLKASITSLQDAKDAADDLFLKSLDSMRDATTFAHDSSIAIIQAENAAFNGFIDSLQILTGDLNPVRAHVDGWIRDIDNGMEAYVGASGEVIKETMRPDGAALEPLLEWQRCWGMAVTGMLLGPANNALCTVQNRLQLLQDAMGKFENSLLVINPVGASWANLKEELSVKAHDIAEKLAYDIAENVTGIDVKQIVELLSKPVDADVLNSIFSVDNSTKGLLLIDDIARRVDREMYLVGQGPVGPIASKRVFNPEKYAVVHNAVVLAKLALLGPQQLNELAVHAGVANPSIYLDGAPLYNNAGAPANLLVDAIGSIDGNHQWMKVAPPYPRRAGVNNYDLLLKEEAMSTRTYGYDVDDKDGQKGFRLWQDSSARKNLFLKIFIGPLIPSLEIPESMGFAPVIPEDYPYVVCEANPYPLTLNDHVSCPIVKGSPFVRGGGGIGQPPVVLPPAARCKGPRSRICL